MFPSLCSSCNIWYLSSSIYVFSCCRISIFLVISSSLLLLLICFFSLHSKSSYCFLPILQVQPWINCDALNGVRQLIICANISLLILILDVTMEHGWCLSGVNCGLPSLISNQCRTVRQRNSCYCSLNLSEFTIVLLGKTLLVERWIRYQSVRSSSTNKSNNNRPKSKFPCISS